MISGLFSRIDMFLPDYLNVGDRLGRDRMVVGFITTMYICNQCLSPLMLWVRISLRRNNKYHTLGTFLKSHKETQLILLAYKYMTFAVLSCYSKKKVMVCKPVLWGKTSSLSEIMQSVVQVISIFHNIKKYNAVSTHPTIQWLI
jgi:hypothetical protein